MEGVHASSKIIVKIIVIRYFSHSREFSVAFGFSTVGRAQANLPIELLGVILLGPNDIHLLGTITRKISPLNSARGAAMSAGPQ